MTSIEARGNDDRAAEDTRHESTEHEDRPPEQEDVVHLGLVAEPDMPAKVVEHLADELPDDLDGSGRDWDIAMQVDSLAAGRSSADEILAAAGQTRDEEGWSYAIVVTDLPIRDDGRAILAHVDVAGAVAVVSLPALGATQPFKRAAELTRQIVDDLTGRADPGPGPDRASAGHGLRKATTRVLAPIRRLPNDPEVGENVVRYSGAKRRGLVRLVGGMVRTNRPWRLVFGLSGALAAALAISVFGLSSSTIWQIATQTSPWRIGFAGLASVGVLVCWLIAYHGLWESRSRGASDREQALLYNLSTIATLLVGVSAMFCVLFVVNLAISLLLIPTDLMSSSVRAGVGWFDYVELAWGFTAMGMVAGALGSSFESDDAVRQAAYGYRERRRRALHAEGEGARD